MRVMAFLSLALVIVFRPCAADEVLSPQSCFSQPIAAWYDGSDVDFTASQWIDKSGNGFDASFTNTLPTLFDDADASNEYYLNGEPVLYGGKSATVLFPDDLIVGVEHTIFNACKYKEGGLEKRILESMTINAWFGFRDGKSGVSYENAYMTKDTDNFGTDWVLSSQTSQLYRGNGIDFTTAPGKGDAIGNLGINAGYGNKGQEGDWACAEILIIDAELSEVEIECVENTYFNCKYGEGFGDGACISRIEHYKNCDDFNIDGFLTECSADFPAEQEALVAVEVRVSTLEDSAASSDSLAETHAAMEAVTADLSAYETATNANLAATDANLASTDVAVEAVSIRVSTIEETLLGFSSARTATAQFDTLPANTGTSLLFGDKDLLIVASLAVNTVLLMALLVVLCRSGKGYKAVGTFAESDSEMAELQ